MSTSNSRRIAVVAALVVVLSVVVPLFRGTTRPDRRLVVYCAHDAMFADDIIRRFEKQSGIDVDVRFDEETNKSLGLTNLLIAEKDAPRCDVFWNNQTLGTVRLKKLGLLSQMASSTVQRIPEKFRDPENQWCGFAARLRVFIINTERMKPEPAVVDEALKSESLQNAAIAVPLFGTTYTHYAVLAGELGLDGLKAWHKSLRDRGIHEVRGNGAVKDMVAEGACDFGFTDTDDAFVAMDSGKPVAMLPVRLAAGQTICIPNSVAVIRNCPHPKEAEEFAAFLLSEDVEIALANSASRQIPLGPVDQSKLPAVLQDHLRWAAEGISLNQSVDQDSAVLEWLTKLYAGQ